jgi:predicted aconitase with swiveling domain
VTLTVIKLRGRRVAGGTAKGEALVTTQQISFEGGIDSSSGIVKERGHELEGKNVKGKILVFPRGKGSSEGALKLYDMSVQGTSPAAIINVETEPIIAIGAVLGKIPTIHKLNKDPTRTIRSGDFLIVDADKGTVKIGKK